jgi:hypothetical protein
LNENIKGEDKQTNQQTNQQNQVQSVESVIDRDEESKLKGYTDKYTFPVKLQISINELNMLKEKEESLKSFGINLNITNIEETLNINIEILK